MSVPISQLAAAVAERDKGDKRRICRVVLEMLLAFHAEHEDGIGRERVAGSVQAYMDRLGEHHTLSTIERRMRGPSQRREMVDGNYSTDQDGLQALLSPHGWRLVTIRPGVVRLEPTGGTLESNDI